ncbi:alpha/beta hydrolase fold domain-containing protein [Streptomyces sp. NPDC059894]|uniref:alpha/beta hydrolase fold domain-containing protein n=1 Tax=unclassified Streptomyces TaxID=2593676 RepID=UPI003662C1F0
MPLLENGLIADALARVYSALTNRMKTARLFPEIPGHASEITIPTRHGDMRALLYRPTRPTDAAGTGVYVDIHGGGYVTGKPEMDDSLCRYLAHEAGVFVISIDYRYAPRGRFPVAPHQSYDALVWAASPEREWSGGAICVGGQSAGGGLAAAACRQALDAGGPAVALQVLQYPPLDLVTPGRDKKAPTSHTPMVRPWMAAVFDKAYIPDQARRSDPLVSPAWGNNSDDLVGIAPALVITAEYDRLRAEAVTYAGKLARAGALVDHHDLPGVDHAYDMLGKDPELTRKMYSIIAEHVRRATT